MYCGLSERSVGRGEANFEIDPTNHCLESRRSWQHDLLESKHDGHVGDKLRHCGQDALACVALEWLICSGRHRCVRVDPLDRVLAHRHGHRLDRCVQIDRQPSDLMQWSP
jgi:hypothetical protein